MLFKTQQLEGFDKEKSGAGTRKRVAPSTLMPKYWKSFVRVNENKRGALCHEATQL